MSNLSMILQRMSAFLTNVSGTVDFYDSEKYQGDSYVPFIGFMLFLFSIVFVFIGWVKISDAKRQWSIFYDNRDAKDLKHEKYARQKKQGKILVIVGLVMLVVSFIVLP